MLLAVRDLYTDVGLVGACCPQGWRMVGSNYKHDIRSDGSCLKEAIACRRTFSVLHDGVDPWWDIRDELFAREYMVHHRFGLSVMAYI